MRYLMMGATAAIAMASVPATAATVTFGEVAIANQTAVTNQYQSYGFTGSNLYYYVDSRDTFDGKGVSGTANPSDFNFLTPISNLSIDYVTLGTLGSASLSVFSGSTLLSSFAITGTSGNVNASRTISGSGITKLSFTSANPGYFTISTLRFTQSSGAVPEPATWAMMLIGFGAAGYAMRRRTRVATSVRFV